MRYLRLAAHEDMSSLLTVFVKFVSIGTDIPFK